MTWVAVAVVGGTLIGGYMSGKSQKDAAGQAADAQRDASAQGIEEQRRQFDSVQALLKPYVDAGGPALYGQQSLIGLNGPAAQKGTIGGIEGSPEFAALTQQGENALLQNASATGGLRGGNLQTSLAKFRPSLLSALINQQFERLGKFTTLGQNSAVMQGNAGMATGNNITDLLQQAGAATAGGALATGKANANMWSTVGAAPGLFAGLGGFKGFGGQDLSQPDYSAGYF